MWPWLPLRVSFTKICVISRPGCQGRNIVRWRRGEEASLAPPCSNVRSFGSKCTVLKKILVTFLGLFGVPRSHRRPHGDPEPGVLRPPWAPRYVPAGCLGLRMKNHMKSVFFWGDIFTCSFKARQIFKDKIRAIYYVWLDNTHCLSIFLFLFLVILTILRGPNRDLYQHFFSI